MVHEKSLLTPSTTILLVEDDRRLLLSLRKQLTAAGYQCIACSNTAEAMAQFNMGNVHLVVTDWTMPGVDGQGLVGLIRNQSNVPIVVITGQPHKCRLPGHLSYNISLFRKPFEFSRLNEHIHAVLTQTPMADVAGAREVSL